MSIAIDASVVVTRNVVCVILVINGVAQVSGVRMPIDLNHRVEQTLSTRFETERFQRSKVLSTGLGNKPKLRIIIRKHLIQSCVIVDEILHQDASSLERCLATGRGWMKRIIG